MRARARLERETSFSGNELRAVLACLALLASVVTTLLLADALRQDRQNLQEFQEYIRRAPSRTDFERLSGEARTVNDLAKRRAGLYTGSFIVAALLFIAWFRRAYRNLGAFGLAGWKASRLGVVWSCLIPGLNLVRPYVLMQETWRGSSKEAIDSERTGRDWRELTLSSLVTVSWWALVVGLIAPRLLGTLAPGNLPEPNLDALVAMRTAQIAALGIMAIALLLAVWLVVELTVRQRASWRHLQELRVTEAAVNT